MENQEEHDLASKADVLHERVPTEVVVASIWADVLGLEEGDIRNDDDFFDLGGHSIAAAQVIRQINRRFGIEVPLRALFNTPTVAGLALAVTQAQAEAEADIDRMLAHVEQMQSGPVSQESSEGYMLLERGQAHTDESRTEDVSTRKP